LENGEHSGRISAGYAVCLILVLSAAAWSFHMVSFDHAKMTVLVLPLPLMAGLAARRGTLTAGIRAFLPVWIWLAAALCISRPAFYPYAAEEALRVAVLLLFAAAICDFCRVAPWKERILSALLLSADVVALLALSQYLGITLFLFPRFETYTQPIYSVFGNQDLLGGYLAIFLPLRTHRLLTGSSRRIDQILLFAVTLLALALSGCRSAWLAAACGTALAIPWRRLTFRALAPVLGTGLAAAGLALLLRGPELIRRVIGTFGQTDTGGRARLWFWDAALRMIGDHGISGAGLGHYGYYSPAYQGAALHAPGGEKLYHNLLHTVHAHNEALEYVAETGLLAAAAIVMIWRLRKGRDRIAAACLLTLIVFSLFNAALHSAPHALAGLIFAAMLLPGRPDNGPCAAETRSVPARKLRQGLFSAAALIIAAGWVYAVLIPGWLLREAEDIHIAGGSAEEQYRRALAWPWPAPEAAEELAMYLMDRERYAEALPLLRLALDGIDTGRIHLLLGRAHHATGDKAAAAASMRACLFRWPAYEEAWRFLFVRASGEERADLIAHGIRFGLIAPENRNGPEAGR
jgi:O-antigen ligase